LKSRALPGNPHDAGEVHVVCCHRQWDRRHIATTRRVARDQAGKHMVGCDRRNRWI
jgi:hypothetical protein